MPGAPTVRVGDVVELITRRLGIRSCRGCARRREIVNRIGELPPKLQRVVAYLVLRGVL